MYKKQTIGIDIDATLTEAYYWIPWANAHFNRNLTPEDMVDYEIHKVLSISEERYLAFYEQYGEAMHATSRIRPEAPEILKQLTDNHHLHYITARHPKMQHVTEEWLSYYQVPVDGLHLLGSHHKVEKAHELKCNLFIEDRYENALAIAESGIDVLLMDCYYNQDRPLPSNVKRVTNWHQVKEFIDLMKKTAA